MADLNLLRALLEEELAKTSPGRQPASDEMIVDPMNFAQNSSSVMPMDRSTDPFLGLADYFQRRKEEGGDSVEDPAEKAGISKNQRRGNNSQDTRLDVTKRTVEVVPGVLDIGPESPVGQKILASPAYKAQQADLGEYETLGRDLLALSASQPVQPDLRPALALSDTFFGSNFSSQYDAPKRDDFYKRLTDYMAQKSKLKNELTERYKELVSASKTEGTTSQTIARLIDAIGADRGYGGQGAPQFNPFQLQPDEKIRQDALNKFNADVKPYDERISAANTVLKETQMTGPGAKLNMKAIQTQLTKLRGETGPLSTYDVIGTSESQAWKDKIDQWFARAETGEFTRDNLLAVRDLAETMRNATIQNRRNFAKQRARQVEQNFPRLLNPGAMFPIFDDPSLVEVPVGSPVGTVWKGKFQKVAPGSDQDPKTWGPVKKQEPKTEAGR